MALTTRLMVAVAAALLLVAGCGGDDEPSGGESGDPSPVESGSPIIPSTDPSVGPSTTPTEPGVTPDDDSSPSSTPTESDPVSSGHVDNCALGASAIKARIAGAKGEQDPVEPGQPKDGSCTWEGQSGRLIVSTDEPSEFTPMAEAKKRFASSGAEFRQVPELGREAYLYKVSNALTIEFRTTGLRVKLDGARIEEGVLLAIAKAVHTDAGKVS